MKNKKIEVKKYIAWGLFVLVIMWLIQFGNFGTNEVKEDLTPPKTREFSSQPNNQGWIPTEGRDGYEWFKPDGSVVETKLFNIDPDKYNCDYFIVNSCIQQFIAPDGYTVIASFKVDVNHRENPNFLESHVGSGIFSTTPWPRSEHTEAWQKSKYVKFVSLDGQRLRLSVGRN